MFNFGNFQNEHKTPFGPLYVLNDDTLTGGRSISLLEEGSVLIILQVVGAVRYRDSYGNETSVIAAGEVKHFVVSAGTSIELANPFEEGLINLLQFWIKAPLLTELQMQGEDSI
ncbi:MAG TPA: hypothetical protein VF609_10915 [Flavisolibacter sp.]